MNVTLNSDGILKISASTDLEAYALKQWMSENLDDNHSSLSLINIMFDASLPTEFNTID